MKKFLLTLVTGMFISSLAFAASADLFTYDANQVDQEMAQLQTLEDFVAVNPGVTLSGLQQEENSLLADLNLLTYANGGIAAFSGEPALGIPSFLWGCILGPVGILIVYLVSEDGDETKKALFGCLAWGGAWTIFYVVRYIFWYVV
jgi:hypothetical protein